MIDHKCGKENNKPPKPKYSLNDQYKRRILNIPNDACHRTPLPEYQKKYETGQKNKSTAFNYWAYYLGPPLFKSRPCHDAML